MAQNERRETKKEANPWGDCTKCGKENCVMWGDDGGGLAMLCAECGHVYGSARLGVLDESLADDIKERVNEVSEAAHGE